MRKCLMSWFNIEENQAVKNHFGVDIFSRRKKKFLDKQFFDPSGVVKQSLTLKKLERNHE